MKNVIIMGAAGRDFHNFNVCFRNNRNCRVVAFTASQIPGIENRVYPRELSGRLYPKGIQIHPEYELPKLIKQFNVEEVFLSYSDLSHQTVMEKASLVLSNGPRFSLMGSRETMLKSKKTVIAVTAVRTGCGKSQTTRKICEIMQRQKKKMVAVRHPMPYGNLREQICQRFATKKDLKKFRCTIEEREEYEPLIEMGIVVYAGVDYQKILDKAEKEADIIVWDGGNNDLPFYTPNVHIVIADPLRAGHELTYYPGLVNLMMADIVIINKVNSATRENLELVLNNVRKVNQTARIIKANSMIIVEKSSQIKGKSVLVIEDGPTLTHGEMRTGAGVVAAGMFGAKRMVSPVKYAVGSIRETFERYPHVSDVLPAMGYSEQQIADLERTVNSTNCELVLIATPIDLGALIKINKPWLRVRYELNAPELASILIGLMHKNGKTPVLKPVKKAKR